MKCASPPWADTLKPQAAAVTQIIARIKISQIFCVTDIVVGDRAAFSAPYGNSLECGDTVTPFVAANWHRLVELFNARTCAQSADNCAHSKVVPVLRGNLDSNEVGP